LVLEVLSSTHCSVFKISMHILGAFYFEKPFSPGSG